MGSVVHTSLGDIKGVRRDGMDIFLGIPYGKPPVGELRFMPPEPAEPWEGVRDGSVPGNKCMQTVWKEGFYFKEFYDDPAWDIPMSEDCLYLNVCAPAGRSGPLPVAVWLHGGAFLGGYSLEKEFYPKNLVAEGVVLVTVEYRCNVFGFFTCPELAEQGVLGNQGILDQLAALRWVRENIAAFGGDPERVTVFGQSAGAISVQTLVSSPRARGLIHRAILQSGGGYPAPVSRCRSAEAMLETGREVMEAVKAGSLEELRRVPAERLLDGAMKVHAAAAGRGEGLVFSPVIDGDVLTAGYQEACEAGGIMNIDYMIGCTENDLGSDSESAARGERPPLYKSCVGWSLLLERLGRRPAYAYYFKRRLPGDEAGAFHSSELWYMFGSIDLCWRPMTSGDIRLSREMTGFWAGFIKNGDPGEGWGPCTGENQFVMEFDAE